MATLILDNVNVYNSDSIDRIADIAGYARAAVCINECRYKIDIDPDDLASKHYSKKVKEMIGEFVMHHFVVIWED